jgi:hypothetical protein
LSRGGPAASAIFTGELFGRQDARARHIGQNFTFLPQKEISERVMELLAAQGDSSQKEPRKMKKAFDRSLPIV